MLNIGKLIMEVDMNKKLDAIANTDIKIGSPFND